MAGDSLANEHRNIRWRSVFNLCDLHSNQKGRGLRYGRFARSYQVMLCNFKVFKENQELMEYYTLRNPKGRELCDAVTAVFIDLSQAKQIAKKPVSEMSDIEQWVTFFALGNRPEYGEVIAEITKQQEGIAVANEVLLSISQNPDERARFRSRRIWLQDREHEQAVWTEEVRAEYEPLLASQAAEIASQAAEIASQAAEIASQAAENRALRAQLEALLGGQADKQ